MRRYVWWGLFGLAAVAGVLMALLFVGEVVAAVTGNASKGATRTGAIGAAVITALLAAGLWSLARLFEHRARSGQFARVEGVNAGSQPPVPAGRVGSRRPRRHTPHSQLLAWMAVLMVWLIMLGAGVDAFVHWRKSEAVQHHGAPVLALVEAVTSVEHSSRSGSYRTYDMYAALIPPFKGHATTKIHTPYGKPPAAVGETFTVLVDRSDPGYAELSGAPLNSLSGFIALLAIPSAAVILVVVVFLSERRRGRRRHA